MEALPELDFDASPPPPLETRPVRFGAWGVEDDKWLALFRSLYTKEFLPRLVPEVSRDLVENKDTADRREPGRSRIPFVIHHIWLGSEMPARFSKLRDGWRNLHPASHGWQFILWDDARVEEELKRQPLINADLYEKASNWGQKSDILRMELLLRYGGVYVDVDFVCVAPLCPLLRTGVGMLCGLSNVGFVEVNNGLIACTPNHPAMQECVASLAREGRLGPDASPRRAGADGADQGSDAPGGLRATLLASMGLRRSSEASGSSAGGSDDMDTISTTGPGFFTRCVARAVQGWLAERCSEERSEAAALTALGAACVVLPTRFFYPLANTRAIDAGDDAALGLVVRQLQGRDVLRDPHAAHGGAGRACSAVFAAHLWARSWCNPQPARPRPAVFSRARAAPRDPAASHQRAEHAQEGDGQRGTGLPSGSGKGQAMSNSDMVWLANLALSASSSKNR